MPTTFHLNFVLETKLVKPQNSQLLLRLLGFNADFRKSMLKSLSPSIYGSFSKFKYPLNKSFSKKGGGGGGGGEGADNN